MDVSDLLSPDQVFLDVPVAEKSKLLAELAAWSAMALGCETPIISQALLAREELGSTGMGAGVAMPHARLPEVARPFGMLIRLTPPIPFDAIDGRPVDLVFALLLPKNSHLEQLNALSCVARFLRDPQTISSLRLAKNVSDLRPLLNSRRAKNRATVR